MLIGCNCNLMMLWPIWGFRHHVLAGQDQEWVPFSGLAMDFDFVEAPSQMLEKWPVRLVALSLVSPSRPLPLSLPVSLLSSRTAPALDVSRQHTARRAPRCTRLRLFEHDPRCPLGRAGASTIAPAVQDLVWLLQRRLILWRPLFFSSFFSFFSFLPALPPPP